MLAEFDFLTKIAIGLFVLLGFGLPVIPLAIYALAGLVDILNPISYRRIRLHSRGRRIFAAYSLLLGGAMVFTLAVGCSQSLLAIDRDPELGIGVRVALQIVVLLIAMGPLVVWWVAIRRIPWSPRVYATPGELIFRTGWARTTTVPLSQVMRILVCPELTCAQVEFVPSTNPGPPVRFEPRGEFRWRCLERDRLPWFDRLSEEEEVVIDYATAEQWNAETTERADAP